MHVNVFYFSQQKTTFKFSPNIYWQMSMPSKLSKNDDEMSWCRTFLGEDCSRTSLPQPQAAFTAKTVKCKSFSPVCKWEILCYFLASEILYRHLQQKSKYRIHTVNPHLLFFRSRTKRRPFGCPHIKYTSARLIKSCFTDVTSREGGYRLIYLSTMVHWVRLLHYSTRIPQSFL